MWREDTAERLDHVQYFFDRSRGRPLEGEVSTEHVQLVDDAVQRVLSALELLVSSVERILGVLPPLCLEAGAAAKQPTNAGRKAVVPGCERLQSASVILTVPDILSDLAAVIQFLVAKRTGIEFTMLGLDCAPGVCPVLLDCRHRLGERPADTGSTVAGLGGILCVEQITAGLGHALVERPNRVETRRVVVGDCLLEASDAPCGLDSTAKTVRGRRLGLVELSPGCLYIRTHRVEILLTALVLRIGNLGQCPVDANQRRQRRDQL